MAYIGFFPTEAGFQNISFRPESLTKTTQTASGRTVRVTNSTTIWSGRLRFPTLSLTEFLPIQAFVARCQGGLNEFDIVLPIISTSSSANFNHSVGTVNLDAGTFAAGTTSADFDCGTGPTTGVLLAGDVIQFQNHTKVYMVTEDANSDASGNGTVNFTPPLTTAVTRDSTGSEINTKDVAFRVILTGTQEFGYRTDGLIDFEIDIQEVI